MTALSWDEVGSHRAEAGVDHGVLYLLDGTAVVWNGITSIEETGSRTSVIAYLAGQKYLDYQVPSDFQATLQALSYPAEFANVNGIKPWVSGDLAIPGLEIYDQPAQPFHLSYRTLLLNDLDGDSYGYKIHVLYNVMAAPSQKAYTTDGDALTPIVYSWDLTTTPEDLTGYRATAHIAFDSTRTDPTTIAQVESTLYGTDSTSPSLPDLQTFINTLAS